MNGHKNSKYKKLILSLDTLCTCLRRTNVLFKTYKVYLFFVGGGDELYWEEEVIIWGKYFKTHPLILIKFGLDILPLRCLNLDIWLEEEPKEITHLKAGSCCLNSIK